MKRLGVRLAAGAAVIVLGFLAVAMAQQEHLTEATEDWDRQTPAALLAGTPIPAEPDDAWQDQTPSTVFRGNNSSLNSPSDVSSEMQPMTNVRTVAHETTASPPQQASSFTTSNESQYVQPTESYGPSYNIDPEGNDSFAADSVSPPVRREKALGEPVNSTENHFNANAQERFREDYAHSPNSSENTNLETPQSDAAPSYDVSTPTGNDDRGTMPYEVANTGPSSMPADDSVSGRVLHDQNPLRSQADSNANEPYTEEIPYSNQVQNESQGSGVNGYQAPAYSSNAQPEARLADLSPSPNLRSSESSSSQPNPESSVQSYQSRADYGQTNSFNTERNRVTSNALGNVDAVLAVPGDRRIEGPQAPSVVIHKRAPEEVSVGKPAVFVIHVRNAGTANAENVRVFDRIPKGMQLTNASPMPERSHDLLAWSLGTLEPGGEQTVTLQMVPQVEGELGSVARVAFEASASVRTRSTRPELRVTQRSAKNVLIGQQLEIDVLIENIGTGSASNVIIEADIPAGLEHEKGHRVQAPVIRSLGPGESRTELLTLRATKPGSYQNIARVTGEALNPIQHTLDVTVVAPKLDVNLNGPSRRYLNREATYNLSVANLGDAVATNLSLVASLDQGLTFVSTENKGIYDPAKHAVLWSLEELKGNERGLIPLTLMPTKEGQHSVRMQVDADLNLQVRKEKQVIVQSSAELTFAVKDSEDPIEVGSHTLYEIDVQNSGTRSDSNIQLQVFIPEGIEVLEADPQAQQDQRNRGTVVVFEPLRQLSADSSKKYRIRVRGTSEGIHVMKATLTSQETGVPVTKEESTTIYIDGH